MRESRASKEMQASFRAQRYSDKGGKVGRRMEIDKNPLKSALSNESKLRSEVQITIKRLVSDNTSVEKIKMNLDKEEYKSYEQYFDEWIKDWVIKLNPDIKSLITKAVNRNGKEDEILSEIESRNIDIYKEYESYIRDAIRKKIQEKQRKIEELKNKEELR